MPVILRGAKPSPRPVAPPASQSTAEATFKSPFKESAHDYDAPPAPAPAKTSATPAPAPTPKPIMGAKKIIKLTGGKPMPIKPAASVVKADAVAAGLTEAPNPSLLLYPAVAIGEIVVVTNDLFPWCKEYRPGDKCVVESHAANIKVPSGDDPIKYRCYFLRVTEGPRKGNHDARAVLKKVVGFNKWEHYRELRIGHDKVVLSHFPMLSWNGMSHGSYHIHGHCHGELKYPDPLRNMRIFDVGIDNIYRLTGKYRPVTFKEVKDYLSFSGAHDGYGLNHHTLNRGRVEA